MAERYHRNNVPNEPEANDSSREECEQVAFGFMTAKVKREMVRSKSEDDKKLLDTFQTELDTARRGSIHERTIHLPPNIPSIQEVSDPVHPPSSPSPDSAPAESAGIVLGELEDVLEQHSTTLAIREPQSASPMNMTAIPFYFAGPTQTRGHFSDVRERVDEAVNRIIPSGDSDSSNPDQPVPPPPPLDRSYFYTIVRELIQVADGNTMNPGQLTICLYFCYKLGVRMVTQYLANRLGLGNTLRDLMETCVQFLVEQELLPIVQQQGGWGNYIDQWLQPSQHPVIPTSVIGYVGLGVAIGFVLGLFVRTWRS